MKTQEIKEMMMLWNERLLKWDKYFFGLCEQVSKNSSCLSRQIGCLLVEDKTIIGTGYNGPPRGVPHCQERMLIDKELQAVLLKKGLTIKDLEKKNTCPRRLLGYGSGEGLQWCIAGHAERNALINSARMGIQTKGRKLYMNCGIPCTPCLVEIINSGVESITCSSFDFYDASAKYLLDHCELNVRLFSHLCSHSKKNIDKELSSDKNKIYLCSHCGAYIL